MTTLAFMKLGIVQVDMCQSAFNLFRSLDFFFFFFKKLQVGIIVMLVICNHKCYKSKADNLGENAEESSKNKIF